MKTVFELDCGTQFEVRKEVAGGWCVEISGREYSLYRTFVNDRKYIMINGMVKGGTIKNIHEQVYDAPAQFVTKTDRTYPVVFKGDSAWIVTAHGLRPIIFKGKAWYTQTVINDIIVYGIIRIKAGSRKA